jgi:hypothetical protein
MVLTNLSVLGVVLASVIGWLLGWLWHSPYLFGPLWMKCSKLSTEQLIANREKSMIYGFLNVILGVVLLGLLLSFLHPGSIREALDFSFIAWLALQLPSLLSSWIFEQRSPVMLAINGGFSLLLTLVTAVILTITA